jgi:hypothetical protein
MERVHVGGYQIDSSLEYDVYSQLIDESGLRRLVHLLQKKKRKGKNLVLDRTSISSTR